MEHDLPPCLWYREPSVADTLGVLVTYLQVTRRWIVCSVPLSPRIAECPRPVDEVDLASLAGILNLDTAII